MYRLNFSIQKKIISSAYFIVNIYFALNNYTFRVQNYALFSKNKRKIKKYY